MNPSETRGDVTELFRYVFDLRPPQAFNTDHLVHIGNTLLEENAGLLETWDAETSEEQYIPLADAILQSFVGLFQRLADEYKSDVTHQLLVMWWKQLEWLRLDSFHPEKCEEAEHLLYLNGPNSTSRQRLSLLPCHACDASTAHDALYYLLDLSRRCKWTAVVQPPVEPIDRAANQAGSNEDESIESTSAESDRAANQAGSNEDESTESTSAESDRAANQAGSNEESIESTPPESDRAANQADSNQVTPIESTTTESDEVTLIIESTPPETDRAASDDTLPLPRSIPRFLPPASDDSESSEAESESRIGAGGHKTHPASTRLERELRIDMTDPAWLEQPNTVEAVETNGIPPVRPPLLSLSPFDPRRTLKFPSNCLCTALPSRARAL